MASPERLEVKVDGITYKVPRRKFKSGNVGFFVAGGAIILGRQSWVQIMVIDRPPMSAEDRIKKRKKNRELREKYEREAQERLQAEAEAYRRSRGKE